MAGPYDTMKMSAGSPRNPIADLAFPIGPYTTWTDQPSPLGTRVEIDGRVFQMAYATEDLAEGDLCTHLPEAQAIAAAEFVAAAAGSTVLTISAAGVAVNEFQNGYLLITAGAGLGQLRKVMSNTATTLTLYHELTTAIDATTSVGLLFNSPFVVRQSNSGQAEAIMGNAPVAVDMSVAPYFLLQREGLGVCQAGTTTIDIGEHVTIASDDDGSGETDNVVSTQGVALNDAADGVFAPVMK